MSEIEVLIRLRRELYELMGALSIQEIMGNTRLIEKLKSTLRFLDNEVNR